MRTGCPALVGRASIGLSLLALARFAVTNVVPRSFIQDNPFLSLAGILLLISQWNIPVWQILILLGALLTLVTVFWLDWAPMARDGGRHPTRSSRERSGR